MGEILEAPRWAPGGIKISNSFYQGEQATISFGQFLHDQDTVSEDLKILAQFFQVSTISILAIHSNRRQETVSVP